MGAVASRHMAPLSDILQHQYFIQKKSVCSYMGWHGVGMSMAAKAVAKVARESKLFDVVMLVRAGEKCSPRKLQTRIAKQLGIIHRDDDDDDDDDDRKDEVDKEVGRMISQSLGSRKFLLIVDTLLHAEGIRLESMGVPIPQEWDRNKIFITTPNWEVISVMNCDDIAILSAPQFEEAPPQPAPAVTFTIKIRGVDELLEHFLDEAGDVADALSNNNAIGGLQVQVSRDQVFRCFIYLCLLQKQEANEKELMRYYVGEGLSRCFIIRSLLQDGKEKDDLEAAFKVGQAVLGEMVSRFMVEKSSPDDDGKLSVNSHLWNILQKRKGLDHLRQSLHIQLETTHVLEHDAKWMALSNNNNIQTLLQQQPYHKNPQLTTLLLINNPQLAEIPGNFFLGIPNLKVLDLSRTSISSLPPSLSSLVHLRFLKLGECLSLNSLPPTPLKDLKRLIILDLHATPISDVPTEAFEQMPDLRLLDLSNTNIHALSSSLLSSLRNLEQLYLSSCGSLGVSLPGLLRQLSALVELDVSGCGALGGVESVCIEEMPKLRAVNLSNTQIARLSFKWCRSLEIVRLQGLANLKCLHLSSLKIEEFSCDISELKSLQRLRLTDMQHLERVNWKKVRWLPKNLPSLLLNDSPQVTQIPDNLLQGMPNLEELDLSRTSISSLPPSLSSLVHLRRLKLRECSSLNSLPSTPLKDLKRLDILDLHGTPLSTFPTEAFEQMPHLRLLDLSNTNIHAFSSLLLSSLRNLKQLFLSDCGSLVVSLPALLRQLSALEELDVSGCRALKGVENVSLEDIPKLRAINLSNTKIARLSFTRCGSLEIVRLQGLANLKSLHLSSLKMEEFPCDISELKSLEQLRLTDVQYLERANWEKVRWLPEKLEWDQCGCSTASALRPEEQAENRASSAYISVSNANIFRGIDSDSPIWENCLSKFHIYICPCGKQKEKKEKEKAAVVDVKRRKMPRVYARIHSEINRNLEKQVEGLSRRLEIEGVDRVLHRSSMKTVVGKAEVLWLRGNGFVKSLSTDFGLEREEVAIKECRVERCHNMGHLFAQDLRSQIWGLKGRLWVSDMGTLWNLYDVRFDFTHLKHLHIQCCPRLIKLFGGETSLRTLETLHVRFCARLEQVHEYYRGNWAFPKLRIGHLWELPKLKGFCNWHHLPPRLEKLRVRACPKLQRLPIIPTDHKGRVTIEGESDWWTNLKWDNQRNIKKEAIDFKSSNVNDP